MLNNFQADVFVYLLVLLLSLTSVWLLLLHGFFKYIALNHSDLHKLLGSPDFAKMRMGNDLAIIKYIFSKEGTSTNTIEIKKRNTLRRFFSLYILYSVLLGSYVVFVAFFKVSP